MKDSKRNFRWIAMTALSVLVMFSSIVFPWVSTASAKDHPPYLVSPYPEPDSTNNPVDVTIKAGITDDETYVDPSSLVVWVKVGQQMLPPIFEPIIEESFGGHGLTFHINLDDLAEYFPEGFPYGETTRVTVNARDSEGNAMMDYWEFTLAQMKFNESVHPLYPLDGMPLNYDLESHNIRFSWTNGVNPGFYRMSISMENKDTVAIDYGPGDYENNFGIITVTYPINEMQWSSLSNLGTLTWRIAAIDQKNGSLLDDFSDPFTARFVSGELSILTSPMHMAVLKADNPPVFRWVNNAVLDNYYIVLVRCDDQGAFTGDVHSDSFGFYLNTYPMSSSTWNTFSPGIWAWTIIGEYAPGQYTDFMIYHFMKKD